jgi:hypothetical protein
MFDLPRSSCRNPRDIGTPLWLGGLRAPARKPNQASNTSISASVIGTSSGQSSVTVHSDRFFLAGRPFVELLAVNSCRDRPVTPPSIAFVLVEIFDDEP